MTDTIFCGTCGEPIPADSNFCEYCGARQESRPARRRPVVSRLVGDRPALQRLEALAPGTGDLAWQLVAPVRTPLVAAAVIGGALAAAGTFGVGVILALLVPDGSAVGMVDRGNGAITAGFAQMVDFVRAGYGDGVGRPGPALFLAFPIGACAIAAAVQARRTLGLTAPVRLAGGASVGLVFGCLMLVPGLGAGGLAGVVGDPAPNVPEAVLLAGLWGALGGLLGTWYIVRSALRPGSLAELVPAGMREVAHTAWLALRPLGWLLGLMTSVGTLGWTIETLRESDLRQGNSTPIAVIDAVSYAVEHGVHWTELAAFSQFQLAGAGGASTGVPLPVGDVAKLPLDSDGRFRLLGFSHVMPAYTFIPLLVLLVGSALLMALGAGAQVARSRLPETPWAAAAWGCLVGPIWALTIVILNGLLADDSFGRADSDSVFGAFLLGGLIAGALGGLAGTQLRDRVTRSGVGARARGGAEAGPASGRPGTL